MKKSFIAAALFLLMGVTYASAAGVTLPAGQPKVSRNIVSTELPAALLTSIKTDYKDYWITECQENGKKNREDYYITLENPERTVQLKSSDKTSWEVLNTTEKE